MPHPGTGRACWSCAARPAGGTPSVHAVRWSRCQSPAGPQHGQQEGGGQMRRTSRKASQACTPPETTPAARWCASAPSSSAWHANQHHGGEAARRAQRQQPQGWVHARRSAAGAHQHHCGEAAQRVLRSILQVVLVGGNLLHQPMRAHCRHRKKRHDGKMSSLREALHCPSLRPRLAHIACEAADTKGCHTRVLCIVLLARLPCSRHAINPCSPASRCICSGVRAGRSARLMHCSGRAGGVSTRVGGSPKD